MPLVELLISVSILGAGPLMTMLGALQRNASFAFLGVILNGAVVILASVTFVAMVFDAVSIVPLWVNLGVSILAVLLVLRRPGAEG